MYERRGGEGRRRRSRIPADSSALDRNGHFALLQRFPALDLFQRRLGLSNPQVMAGVGVYANVRLRRLHGRGAGHGGRHFGDKVGQLAGQRQEGGEERGREGWEMRKWRMEQCRSRLAEERRKISFWIMQGIRDPAVGETEILVALELLAAGVEGASWTAGWTVGPSFNGPTR